MKKFKNVFAFVLALSILFLFGCVEAEVPSGSSSQSAASTTQASASSTQTPTSGTQTPSSSTAAPDAPKWGIPDAAVYNAEGELVHLSDFLGKPVIINVWATWCSPCREELPDFQKAYEKYGDQIEFVMINLTYTANESLDKVNVLMKLMEFDFPVYYDKDASTWDAFQIDSVPYTYFVYPNGEMLAHINQKISAEDLEYYIGRLLE